MVRDRGRFRTGGRRGRGLLIPAVLCLGVPTAVGLAAEPPDAVQIGPRIQISSGPNAFTRDITLGPDGALTAVWKDTELQSVRLRRFSPSGQPLMPEIEVASPEANDVSLSMNEAGDFVLAWDLASGGARDVWARRYLASGQALGTALRVNSDSTADDSGIDVVLEPDGAFLATWTRRLPSDPPVSRVLSRRFDSRGQAVGDEVPVTGWLPQASATAVARRPGSDFVVVWQGKYPEVSSYLSMAGTLLDSSGEPAAAPFRIGDTAASTPLSKKAGDVAVQSDGSFVVAWRSPNYYGGYSDVARFSSAAAPLPDPDFGEPTLDDYLGDWSTRLISTPDDGFLVVWSRWAFWQNPRTTLGWQRFHADGSLGQDFEIDTSQRGYYTRIDRRGEEFVIAWEDEGVVAQRFTFEYLFADGFEDGGTEAWTFSLPAP